jgi:hypothetical protein
MLMRLIAAAALLLAVGTATDARAQDKWVKLGGKEVGLGATSDTIEVTQAKGAFKALRLENTGSDIVITRVRVTYGDKSVHNENREIKLNSGERTRPIDPRDANKFVDFVEVTYKSVPGASKPAKIEVVGLQNAAGLAQSRPATGTVPATATTAEAKIFDHILGVQTVEPGKTDRDVIKVGQKYGKFDRVRLKVLETDIDLVELKAVYSNGESEALAVNANVPKNTKTKPLALKGDRFINEIHMVYKTKQRFAGRATVEVWAEYAPGWYGPANPSGWIHLGSDSANFSIDRKDVVPVGRNQGKFRQLRVETNHAITLFSLKVVYDNGEEEAVPVPNNRVRVDPGNSFGPINLKGSRVIKEIQPSYRTRIFARGGLHRAVVEFWGMH